MKGKSFDPGKFCSKRLYEAIKKMLDLLEGEKDLSVLNIFQRKVETVCEELDKEFLIWDDDEIFEL